LKNQEHAGSELLAYGALEAGVQFVSGYPGSPATATVEALLRLDGRRTRIEWAINEKSAFDAALGASLAGVRSLVCLKSVGLNVALDSLMVANLAAGDGGLVVLAGDDPGGWGSQNEEDSRLLAAAAEVPLLEPTSVDDARMTMRLAFDLSERHALLVVVRVTRALSLDRSAQSIPRSVEASQRPASFRRQPGRFNVLPVHVVDFHRQLQARLGRVQAEFEQVALNAERDEGSAGGAAGGSLGIIAAGHAAHKLAEVLAKSGGPPLRCLLLGTLYPLPEKRVLAFLQRLDAVLVLEETAPYVETGVQALAQRHGWMLPIHGRSNGRVPGAGELFAPQIVDALAGLLPNWDWPSFGPAGRKMPSRQSLCENCPYVGTFEALLAVMERHGGRDAFVVTGETGCMVRAQLPPWELLDVKYGMGASIGLATGLARAGIDQKIVALSGDSALLHSGLGELVDAAQAGLGLLVVVLANETTALSGGQPHPATAHDTRGRPRQAVDLLALVRATGADSVQVVDPEDAQATQAAFEAGLASGRLAVVVARRACPKWEGESPR
jgi:indolepyruvate ferredoxin oxidoreductase alpha subunit